MCDNILKFPKCHMRQFSGEEIAEMLMYMDPKEQEKLGLAIQKSDIQTYGVAYGLNYAWINIEKGW